MLVLITKTLNKVLKAQCLLWLNVSFKVSLLTEQLNWVLVRLT